MSFSPILPGRLPSTLLAKQLGSQITKSQAQMSRLLQEASTGQRFFRPGDDPAAATQTVFLQGEIERNNQFIANVGTDQSLLSATDTATQSVSDALNKMKAYAAAGVGDSSTPAEKQAMAQEVGALIKNVVNVANSTFRGRSLFGGSMTQGVPFQQTANGQVTYYGDAAGIDSHLGSSFLMANNLDGATAFNALTTPVAKDVNPALTLGTRLADLHGGAGVPPGQVRVTVNDGVNPVRTATVDLTGAETVGDVKTRIEAAFASGPPGLTVSINGTNDGLRLTPSGGTVTVSDVAGGLTADRLGIASAPAAGITGGDLDPALSLTTKLADLNGGAGINLAGGLRITSGTQTATVDLTGTTTVQDALNAIQSQAKAAGIDVAVGLTDDRTGLAISSRVSGAGFAIGENGGTTATELGIRTFTANTKLADLDNGLGVPVAVPNKLEITRRSGAAVSIDLSSASTVQDVLNAINAVDPGKLVASLNSTGNGITLLDDDGVSTGPLVVASNDLSQALGIAGSETGTDPTVPIVGTEVNPQESGGIVNLMIRLQTALKNGDDRELNRLGPLIDKEVGRFAEVRGDVASRLNTLDDVESRLKDRDVSLKESLSKNFDADMAEVLTEVTSRQTNLEAALRIAAQSMQLTLNNYL
jgi:flagellar hook-associated protein 3 FlgL